MSQRDSEFTKTANVPLILHSHEKGQMDEATTVMANQVYATTAPKILLEVLTARTTAILFVVTYLVFILAFTLDVRSTVLGFNSFNRQLPSGDCPSFVEYNYSSIDSDAGCSYGQTEDSSQWLGLVTGLTNVISVEVKVTVSNFSTVIVNNTEISLNEAFNNKYLNDIYYNVTVYCCYQENGCGNDFSSKVQVDVNAWYLLLDNHNVNADLNPSQYTANYEKFSYILLGYTFQNQEALPMRGKVQSYLVMVDFHQYSSDGNFVSLPAHAVVDYDLNVVSRPENFIAWIITILLLLITIALLVMYVLALDKYNKGPWLPEQKWIIWYLVLIILYQNPVFCVVVWMPDASTGSIFASYLSDAFAQSALFAIWLLFSDGLKRKVTSSRLVFYGPKIAFGTVIMVLQYVVLTLQFCSLDPQNTTRTPLEAVQEWENNVKITFCIFAVGFLMALILWALWWFYSLYWTGKILEKLPYMSTRYLQLSYQFFTTQAILVTLYYVFQYLIVIYFVFRSDSVTNDDAKSMLETVTDNINILFRQQTQLFGKLIFLTFYAFILALLFLPAEIMTENKMLRSLASTYVISEEEMAVVVKSRRKMIRDIKNSNVLYDMNHIVATKAEVFCIDISLVMLNLSYEAYYDPPGCNTESGYGLMDIEQFGYLLIDFMYHEELDMFCFVARHALTNNIVVCFRGSSSKIHWRTNLNFKMRELHLDEMPLIDLDKEDGFQEYVDQYNDLGSDSESEEEDSDDEASSVGRTSHGTGGNSSFNQEERDSDDNSTADAVSSGAVGGAAGKAGKGGKGGKGGKNKGKNDPNRKTFVQHVRGGATRVRIGVQQMATTAGGVATNAVDGATGLIKSAAYKTPWLKTTVAPFVHSGFYEAYEVTREFVHRVLRRELSESPAASVFFTGHSLGGAIATFAAMDVRLHTLPRVNAWLKVSKIRASLGLINKPPSSTNSSLSEAWQAEAVTAAVTKVENSQRILRLNTNSVKSVKITMYNFGSPRLGNTVFSVEYNRLLPDSFRVEVDGDVVTGVPKGSYKHVGTNVTVDALGAGSIIIDPSYLEMRLRTRTKAHVSVHSLIVYRQGLLGVRAAAEYIQHHAKDRAAAGGSVDVYDTVLLAISAGPLKMWSMLGGTTSGKQKKRDGSGSSTSASDGNVYSSKSPSHDKSFEHSQRLSVASDDSCLPLATEDYHQQHKQHQQQLQVADADSVLLQDIENTVPIGPLPRMMSHQGGGLGQGQGQGPFGCFGLGISPPSHDIGPSGSGGGRSADASERKDAQHLQHDNEANAELFASIRAQHEEEQSKGMLGGLGTNRLTPLMQRSIKLFRFPGDRGGNTKSEVVGSATSTSGNGAGVSATGISANVSKKAASDVIDNIPPQRFEANSSNSGAGTYVPPEVK